MFVILLMYKIIENYFKTVFRSLIMKKFLTILLIIMFFSSLNLVCASEFNSTSLESIQEEESISLRQTLKKLSANEESEKFQVKMKVHFQN